MIKEYFLNYDAMNSDFTINLGSGDMFELADRHVNADAEDKAD